MPNVINKSARPITIDGNMIVPGAEGEVSDDAMEWKSVKAMVEAKELEVAKAKAAPAPPAGTAKG